MKEGGGGQCGIMEVGRDRFHRGIVVDGGSGVLKSALSIYYLGTEYTRA